MTHSPDLPTLVFYRAMAASRATRRGPTCRQLLEDRVKRGDPIPRVRTIDVDAHPELKARYGDVIPVLALNGSELPLAMGQRSHRALPRRALGRLA